MITKIKLFTESLSSDKSKDAKLRILIQNCKEMIEANKKAEEFEILKKNGNAEIEALLAKYDKISVIAEGVLIQVTQPYTINKLNLKEYLEFVETSVTTIGEEFKKVHDEIVNLSTKVSNAVEYTRTYNNPKNLPTGTLKQNENLVSDVWHTLQNWFIAFKQKFSRTISNAEQKLTSIANTAKMYMPANESIIPTPDEVTEILKKAKETLEHAKEQAFYEELAQIKQEQIIELLKEFSAKSIAIDNKIITLVSMAAKPKLDQTMYADWITNAEKVDANIAEMASNLMAIHTKVIEVSGSVRHYANNNQRLPDGTFNAAFDWENKRVKSPVAESLGNSFVKIWKLIKSFFGSFKRASVKVDVALNNIG